MRRAYNAGRWDAARTHASHLLLRPSEQTLARSVIVRSYWNEGRFQELVDSTEEWHDELSHSYREQAIDRLKVTGGAKKLTMMKEEKLQRLRDEQPKPKVPIQWSAEHMDANYSQEGSRVWFRYPEGYVFWDMPSDYELQSTHPALLCLTAEVLLSPWISSSKGPLPKGRTQGGRASLSFSAGTDSTAAAAVMDDSTLLGYHRRSFNSMLDHRNAERLINHLNTTGEREVLSISSNH